VFRRRKQAVFLTLEQVQFILICMSAARDSGLIDQLADRSRLIMETSRALLPAGARERAPE
jgi:hypothetical protein